MTILPNNVAFFIPSTIDVNTPIDNSLYVDKTVALLSKHFGGCTISNGVGCWLSDNDGLVKEDVTIVESFFDSVESDFTMPQIEIFANYLKTTMKQEVIAVRIDGILHLF